VLRVHSSMVTADLPRLSAQMSFLLAADGLKKVLRGNRIGDGSRRENSAEHSWHVVLMAMVLVEYGPHPLDIGRVLQLLTVHDLVEVYAGDTMIYDEESRLGQAEREALAAKELFGHLPDDQHAQFESLWSEFELASSPEARFSRAVDALAPTWLHWGEHSKCQPENLTAGQILEKKTQWLAPYPVLLEMMKKIVSAAVDRGLIGA